MYLQTTAQVLSLPPSTNLRQESFDFASFQNNTYAKFISAFEDELQKAFEQMGFRKCFQYLTLVGYRKILTKLQIMEMNSLKA